MVEEFSLRANSKKWVATSQLLAKLVQYFENGNITDFKIIQNGIKELSNTDAMKKISLHGQFDVKTHKLGVTWMYYMQL